MNYIYKITNKINNKIYIGKTTHTVQYRWNQHTSASFTDKNKLDYNYLLHKAIRKYGKENFSLEILEKVEDEKVLSEKEMYYIKLYNSCVLEDNANGYNMTYGGEGPNKINKEKILELWLEGNGTVKISEITGHDCNYIKNLLNTFKEYNKEEDFLRNHGTKVYQYDENGILIKEFPNETCAAKQLGIHPSNISKCCNNKKNSAGGFFWSYSNTANFNPQKLTRWKKKPIIQKDLNNNIIQIFPTMKSVSEVIGTKNTKLLRECCNGIREQAYGFKWEYYNENELVDKLAKRGATECTKN